MTLDGEDAINREALNIVEMFLLSLIFNARGEHPEWLAADSHELITTLWQGGFKIVPRVDYAEGEEMRAHMLECLEDYRKEVKPPSHARESANPKTLYP